MRQRPRNPHRLWITRAGLAHPRLCVHMTSHTPKHRKPTDPRPRRRILATTTALLAATIAAFGTLQPASAAQDANTPADPTLTPSAPTCSATECYWDFTDPQAAIAQQSPPSATPDAYTFALARDGAPRASLVQIDVQAASPSQSWSAQLNDTGGFLIIDFYNGTPRVWVGGQIALQADPAAPGIVAYNPAFVHDLVVIQPDAAATAPFVRVHQQFAPSVASGTLTPVAEADLATLGPDASATAQVTFDSPVSDVQLQDFTPLMSNGCRVTDLSASADGLTFGVVVRGCSSSWMNLKLARASVFGTAPGPVADYYFAPIQPYVSAATAAAAAAAGAGLSGSGSSGSSGSSSSSSSSSPAPTTTPTATSTAAPSAAPTPTAAPPVEAISVVAVVEAISVIAPTPVSTPAPGSTSEPLPAPAPVELAAESESKPVVEALPQRPTPARAQPKIVSRQPATQAAREEPMAEAKPAAPPAPTNDMPKSANIATTAGIGALAAVCAAGAYLAIRRAKRSRLASQSPRQRVLATS